MVRKPRQDGRCPIQARVVAVAGGTIDIRCHPSRGRVRHRILVAGGSGSRHQIDQALVIAVGAQRQVGDLLGGELFVHVCFVGLERRSFPGHGDSFRNRSDFQRRVDAGDVVQSNQDVRLRGLFEPCEGDFDGVRPGEYVRKSVGAHLVCDRLT